jgi:hypothetical protein
MDPDQSAHPRSLIRFHAFRLQTLKQLEKLIENSMDPDQTAQRRRLVWIHARCKRTMLVLSCGSYMFVYFLKKKMRMQEEIDSIEHFILFKENIFVCKITETIYVTIISRINHTNIGAT